MKIALISCTKTKKPYRCSARELYYDSDLFRLSYEYAKTFVDKIYILSAKYGLVEESEIIDTYEKTLNGIDKYENLLWANSVLYQLQKVSDLSNDEFYIFAGRDYYSNLIVDIKKYQLPLGNMRYGERVAYLNKLVNSNNIFKAERKINSVETNNDSYELHKYFNSLRKYTFDEISKIPFDNGIYIFFEEGEKYGVLDRVVRVGTHRSPNRLRNRLKDHIRPNKDGSIFRKNIGRAILNYDNDCYLRVWNMNFSKTTNINKYYIDRNIEKEKKIEERITSYLKRKFKFVCIEIEDSALRLRLEEGIIATLNKDKGFKQSHEWSGKYSPELEIKESGLWLKEGLDGIPLENSEIKLIIKPIDNKVEKISSEDLTIKRNISEADKIRKYFKDMFEKHKLKGDKTVRIICSNVNKAMGYVPHRHSQISGVMWEFYNEKYDTVEQTTPSGKSSTITIIYDIRYK